MHLPTPRNLPDISRDAAHCSKMAARFEPTLGFLAYGVLWLFVASTVTMPATLATIWLLEPMVPKPPFPAWMQVLLFVVMAGTFLLAWWPFGLWVHRRRRRARRLFSHGVIAEATIEPMGFTPATLLFHLSPMTRLKRSKLRFSIDGETYEAPLAEARPTKRPEGSTCFVLFEPSSPRIAVMEDDCTFVAASWNHPGI